MICGDARAARILADMQVEHALIEAEFRRLLRQSGVEPGGWLVKQSRRLVQRLGRRLVATGRQLERYGLTQPTL
jgi:hypothetical protein